MKYDILLFNCFRFEVVLVDILHTKYAKKIIESRHTQKYIKDSELKKNAFSFT